jgi:hypothetical protein
MHPCLTPAFACHRERDVRRELAATRGTRFQRLVACATRTVGK